MPVRGWIYVITNKAMPGLHKIGFSTKDPVLRAEELGHTGSPHPYTVLYDALVEDARGIEQAVHRLLNDKREGKEWFRCSVAEAIEAIKKTAATIFIESISPEVANSETSSTSEPEQPKIVGTCRCYGCTREATHVYQDVSYCYEHFRLARNPGRSEAVRRIRQELKNEWEKRK
jgi:hypothetical protein